MSASLASNADGVIQLYGEMAPVSDPDDSLLLQSGKTEAEDPTADARSSTSTGFIELPLEPAIPAPAPAAS